MKNIAIVISTYNEEKNILNLILKPFIGLNKIMVYLKKIYTIKLTWMILS